MTSDEMPPAPDAPRLPIWARVADALTLAACLLGLSVLLFGGLRTTVAGVRLSVTDGWRPLLWALAIAAARHWRWPATPLWHLVTTAVVRWWRAPDTRAVLPVHLASRLGVLAVGFMAVVLIGYPANHPPPFQVYRHDLLDLPGRWDAGWYLGIATEGYRWSPEDVGVQQNIAFFPAFPLAMRMASVMIGRQPLWAGLAVALVAFFWALVYLLRLGRDLIGDDERARTAVWLLAAYPFALFYSAPYTEALFLLTTAAAVYHFRRDELWKAAGWGLVAGLTRPNGAFLSVVLGLIVAQQAWQSWRSGAGVAWMAHLDRWATAAMPGIGMLLFSTFVLFLTGSPFTWAAQNAAWGRTYRRLDTVFTDRIDFVTQLGVYEYVSGQTLDMFYLASVLFVLVSVWPVYRRFGLPFAAMLLVNLLPPMAAGGLLSIGRVTATLFPTFLWLGAAIPPGHRSAWVLGFALLQGFAAVLFFTWRPLY